MLEDTVEATFDVKKACLCQDSCSFFFPSFLLTVLSIWLVDKLFFFTSSATLTATTAPHNGIPRSHSTCDRLPYALRARTPGRT